MVFSSTIFLFIFLPITLLGYYLIDRRFKNGFLLFASLLFYAWGEPKFVFIMMCSILVNHVFALLVDRNLIKSEKFTQDSIDKLYKKRAKGWLCLMVIFNLSLFFIYKYLNFTIKNINMIIRLSGMEPIKQTNIVLPIGISFFTFQAMSYVFDVYRRKGQVQRNPLNTALYIAFFPQLIAGPIVRYETIAQEIKNRQETIKDLTDGIRRFIIGLAKKTILANSLAVIADISFSYTDFSSLTILMAWLGIFAYAMQVFFDFSGYSDMAIGMGRMFGFHFNENFNYPYISKTIAEFWQRWHISLGTWFRDYLFYPVSTSNWLMRLNTKVRKKWGRKASKNFLVAVPTAIVWFCTGLWHGASWGYIIWGCYYGFLLIMAQLFQSTFKKWRDRFHIPPNAKWFCCIQTVRTFLLVLIADVFFRAQGTRNALRYLGCMFGLMKNSIVNISTVFVFKQSFIVLMIAAILCTPIVPLTVDRLGKIVRKASEPKKMVMYICIYIISIASYLILFISSISFTVTNSYDPFLYFNF